MASVGMPFNRGQRRVNLTAAAFNAGQLTGPGGRDVDRTPDRGPSPIHACIGRGGPGASGGTGFAVSLRSCEPPAMRAARESAARRGAAPGLGSQDRRVYTRVYTGCASRPRCPTPTPQPLRRPAPVVYQCRDRLDSERRGGAPQAESAPLRTGWPLMRAASQGLVSGSACALPDARRTQTSSRPLQPANRLSVIGDYAGKSSNLP